MSSLIRKEIENLKPYVPGKPIEEVKREHGLKSVIKLASNENPMAPSAKVIKAITKSLKDLNRYPDGGSYYLKQAISKKFGVRPENIALGNGSDELIVLAIRAFVSGNDEIMIAKPTFLVYGIAAESCGAKTVVVPQKDFKYDLDRMAERLTENTKLVFIANPDNPTGAYADKKAVEKFMSKIGPNTIVFFDEAYYEFARVNKDYPDTFKYFGKKNVLIARTFSKVYALAGIRLGYAFGDANLISAMDKTREPFNINSIAQAAAVAALGDDAYVKKAINNITAGKKFITRELEKMGYKYIPSSTNFILIDTEGDSKDIYLKLLMQGVIVREMSGWGLAGFIRVTVGTPEENKRFITALKKVGR